MQHINPNGTTVDVILGNRVRLGDGVTLGIGVRLGNDVRLGDGVVLGNRVTLGDDVPWWCAGRDDRGYEMIGYKARGKLIVTMGCRTFTIRQARDHWGAPGYSSPARARDIIAKLDYLEAVSA